MLSEASTRSVLWTKNVLRNFTKLTRKHLCQSLFFNKVATLSAATSLKKDSGTGVFPWILRNFEEHHFYRTPLYNCCCCLWRLATGNSCRRAAKTFAVGKSAVVSIIVYRNILSNFGEPWVEQSKAIAKFKETTNCKLPQAVRAIWAPGTGFS